LGSLFLVVVDDLLVSIGHMLSTSDSFSKVVIYFYFGHSLLLCCLVIGVFIISPLIPAIQWYFIFDFSGCVYVCYYVYSFKAV
jgi:hypothetical protein